MGCLYLSLIGTLCDWNKDQRVILYVSSLVSLTPDIQGYSCILFYTKIPCIHFLHKNLKYSVVLDSKTIYGSHCWVWNKMSKWTHMNKWNSLPSATAAPEFHHPLYLVELVLAFITELLWPPTVFTSSGKGIVSCEESAMSVKWRLLSEVKSHVNTMKFKCA